MEKITGFDSSVTNFIIELISFDRKFCPWYRRNRKYITFSETSHPFLFQFVQEKKMNYSLFSFEHQMVLQNEEKINQFVVSSVKEDHNRQLFFIVEFKTEGNAKKIYYGKTFSFFVKYRTDDDIENILNVLFQYKCIIFSESVRKFFKVCIPLYKFPTLCRMFPEIIYARLYEILEGNSKRDFDVYQIFVSCSESRIVLKSGNKRRAYFLAEDGNLCCLDEFEIKNENKITFKDFLKVIIELQRIECKVLFI